MKKRPFTLIELMISLGLLAMLLGTLFFSYSTFEKQSQVVKQRGIASKELRYFDLRLKKVLPRANLKDFFFTSSKDAQQIVGNSLIFSFDHGIQEEALLSNTVLGRLYLDRETKAVVLGIWPKPETKETKVSQSHILLENVEAIEFEFYAPPQGNHLSISPVEVGPSLPLVGWQPSWKKDYKVLPSMVRVKIVRDKREWVFVYELPLSTENQIIYG